MHLQYFSNPPLTASSSSSHNISLLDESELSNAAQPKLVPWYDTIIFIKSLRTARKVFCVKWVVFIASVK